MRCVTVGCGLYDRTRALFDGRVAIDGYETVMSTEPLEAIFSKAFTTAEYDVTELSFSNYMLAVARGVCAYVGVPVFPSRSFRHSAIYVRSDRGIATPRCLEGKCVGLREFTNTAALVTRGILAEEYGVGTEAIRWRVGDVNEVEREAIPVPELLNRVEIEPVVGRSLSAMLDEGELDALIAYDPPRCYNGNGKVRRLFENWREAERVYFDKTRIFPIMHLVGIRRSLVKEDPDLPLKVMRAFVKARDLALEDLGVQQALKISLPWVVAEFQDTRRLMGDNYWCYGIEKNRPAIEALLRYPSAQGLLAKPLSLEDVFEASALASSLS